MSAQPEHRVIPFDTLQYAKRLQSADVSPEQAAIQAEALQETLIQAFQTADVATKSDMGRLELETRSDHLLFSGEIKSKIDETKHEVSAKVGEINVRIDKMETDMKSGLDTVAAKFDAVNIRFEAMNTKFEMMSAKISAESNKVIMRLGGIMLAILGAIEIASRLWPKV